MKFHMIAGGPKPVAPFSHAVETDGLLFVTGQMPDRPDAPADRFDVAASAGMEDFNLLA